ncbi:cytochrome P450 [Cytidiella melzeri]|nr:cytochrome P450 [Cytidiella melzeri]
MPAVSSMIQAIKDNSSPSVIALSLTAGAVVVVIYKAGSLVIRNLSSPLRNLPGPPNAHFFWGHARNIYNADHSVLQEQWVQEYGPTISYNGLMSVNTLWTMDTRALQHILTNTYTFQRPLHNRFHLARLAGPGVLVAEGDQHRNQRRILNPAFGPVAVRDVTDMFIEKSQLLRDRWLAEIAKSGETDAHIDAMPWLSKAALDMIGIAGFNYNFDALNPQEGRRELNDAFNTISISMHTPRLMAILQAFIPFLRVFKTEGEKKLAEAQKIMRRIGLQLVAEKKASVIAESEQGNIEKKKLLGRDMLTLLVKANMASDIPDSQRLDDDEVLAQFPTFVVAGHETTATATTWAIFSLTQHPDVQRKLRDELVSFPTDNPTMDELHALPYLDMVVKEVLRHHSVVPIGMRVATKDDVIPCSTPYTDRYGVLRDHIRVQKDDMIMIPILAMNRYKPYWGDDALEFRPERWEHPPEAIETVPGVYANMLSFLGGPRACIGYRFSLTEMKALLFTLIREFEFELDVAAERIKKRTAVVQRPILADDESEKKGEGKMPIVIRQYVRG